MGGLATTPRSSILEDTTAMALRDALRRRYYAMLDEVDRGRADSAVEAAYFLNTIMIDVVDDDPLLQERYVWGLIQAGYLAQSLGIERVSLLEFGVGRGDGLVLLERAARRIETRFGVRFETIGFDVGTGWPDPVDPRDIPNLWTPGLYQMDLDQVRSRLDKSILVVGDVRQTVASFLDDVPAPIGWAAFDFGAYHGTIAAMEFLKGAPDLLLPRVHCYFANTLGLTFGDCVGERLAIRDYNASAPTRPVSQIHGLRHYVPRRFRDAAWADRYYMAHLLDHPRYGEPDNLLRHAPDSYKPESFTVHSS